MKKKLFIITILFTLVVMVGCSKNETNKGNSTSESGKEESSKIASIKEKKKLVMGTCADYPPMEWIKYIDGKEEFVGVDIEIGKKIAEELGVELEIKNMGFDGLLGSLKAGDLDIVLAGMEVTKERAEIVDFSEPYNKTGQVLLVRKGEEDKFKSFDDLKGMKIGAQLGTIQIKFAQETYGDNVVGYDNNNNLVKELINNTLDCLFLAELPARQFAAVNDKVSVVKDIGVPDEEGTGIAIQKGNEDLVEVCNKVIKELKDQDQIKKWLDEYIEMSSKEVNEES